PLVNRRPRQGKLIGIALAPRRGDRKVRRQAQPAASGAAGVGVWIRATASRRAAHGPAQPAEAWKQSGERLGLRRSLVAEELQSAVVGDGQDLVAEIPDLARDGLAPPG